MEKYLNRFFEKMLMNTWKEIVYYSLLGKCKLKSHWDDTAYLCECLN